MADEDFTDEIIESIDNETLSEEESVARDLDDLAEVGALLIRRAVLSFSSSLSPAYLPELEKFLDQNEKSEDLLDKLVERYPAFLEALTEEIKNYRTEMEKTFGVEKMEN